MEVENLIEFNDNEFTILSNLIRLLIFLLIPFFAFADKHVPYYKSLSKSESGYATTLI